MKISNEKKLPSEILSKILQNLGYSNIKPFFKFRGINAILDLNPQTWNIYSGNYTSILRQKHECLQIIRNNSIFINAIMRKLEKVITFKTMQSDMTHVVISGLIYISSDDQTVKAFDFNGRLVKKFIGHTGGVWTFDILDNGRLVTGSTDKTCKIWDFASESVIDTLKCHRSTVRVLKQYNNYIITGSRDHTIGVWNTSGNLLYKLEGHMQSVRSLDISGYYLVTGSYDGCCKLWDYKKGKYIKNIQKHDKRVYCVKIYNGYVASGGLDSVLKISKIDSDFKVSLRLDSSVIAWIDFQDKFVVASSLDGTVAKYNYMSQEIEFKIQETSSIKSQKIINNMIIIGTAKEVKIYSFATGRLLRVLMQSYMISKVEADGFRIFVGHMLDGEYQMTIFNYEDFVTLI